MDLTGQKVLIVGLGRSGMAAARFCLSQGARVTATDLGPGNEESSALAAEGVDLVLESHREEDFTSAQVVVLSPGVDVRLPQVRAAREKGVEVIGELELGWRHLPAPSLMISGTNGKSTVTTLAGRMLAASGMRVFVGGNLGTPLCEFLLGDEEVDWAVLEVSSFQLDSAPRLHPQVGVLLNVSPDHLDRYDSPADYFHSKYSLFLRQKEDELAILCADDPGAAAARGFCPGEVWTYGQAGPEVPGGWLEEAGMVLDRENGENLRLSLVRSPLLGEFNRLNLLAAGLSAWACGADPIAIQAAVDHFRGLPHRLQLVGQQGEVDFINDSKATNVGAVKAALTGLGREVILLLGGRDKEGRFAELAPELAAFVHHVICFGEAGADIAAQLQGLAEITQVKDLAEALQAALGVACKGQTVLLSPGCASFDAYENYAQRGNHFFALVREALDG